MILFWDKNVPKTIPEALRLLKPGVGIEIYIEKYPMSDKSPESGDDRWLNDVGSLDWIVITQDWNLHNKTNELYAIKQHNVGCFYLWGAEAPKWSIMRCFARGYDRIIQAASNTPKPFIFRVTQTGLLRAVPIP